MANHVSAHIVGPQDALGTNAADKEGLGQPSAHQHHPFLEVVCQEKSHGSA
jgi:hypothetical protein